MPLALLCLCVFVLAQNIFIELHVCSKKIFKPRLDALSILEHFFRDVIGVDVNANGANDSEFFSLNRNGGAFEFSRADVQLVVQLVLIHELATFQIDQQIGCAIAQVPAGHIIFERNQRVRWIGKIVKQDLDSGIWK